MLQNVRRAIAIALVLGPWPALAAPPDLQLKQSSSWNVDYAEDQCRLMRQFGEGDEKVYTIFDRFGPGERFRLMIAGKPMRTWVEEGEATIQFGPNEAEQKLRFYKGTLGELPALLFQAQARLAPPSPAEQAAIDKRKDGEWIDLAPIDQTREAGIQTLTIGKPLRRTVVLEIGPMRKPFEALGKCVDDLVTSWGIDTEKHKQLMRPAKPLKSPSTWVVSDDYPLNMLSIGQPAIVEFRLNIGTDGTPVSCYIQSTTRPKQFDDAVCGSLMRRARFEPALDAQGQPLISFYRNTVRFALP